MEEKNRIINISLVEVIRLLMADRKKVYIYTLAVGMIGVILAFATPKIYKSVVILAPEESGAGFSGSISSLASMVGMNMKIGQTGDALYPEIYPDLMESTDFIVGLFPITVTTDKTGKQYTYQEYIREHQKEPLYKYPFLLLGNLLEKLTAEEGSDSIHVLNPFHLTKKEYNTMKAISGKIKCSVDKKTNVITIEVTDQDPLIAATVADSVQIHLQHSITDYRTNKARIDMDYMQELFNEAHEQYVKARQEYAQFVDANQELVLQSYRQQEEELENEMQLKYNIYQQVVEQFQLAKAKVQERTPAFTIIQRASVPIKHSNRSKLATLIIWMILGFMLRSGLLLWKNRQQFINL